MVPIGKKKNLSPAVKDSLPEEAESTSGAGAEEEGSGLRLMVNSLEKQQPSRRRLCIWGSKGELSSGTVLHAVLSRSQDPAGASSLGPSGMQRKP